MKKLLLIPLLLFACSAQALTTTYTNQVGFSTNSSNVLSIPSGGSGQSSLSMLPLVWTTVSGTSQSLIVGNGYYNNNAGLVTDTLPTTCTVGDIIIVDGQGAGGWKITQNASQLIHYGSSTTTTGTGGSLASTNQWNSVTLRCAVTNTTWTVESSIGILTVV